MRRLIVPTAIVLAFATGAVLAETRLALLPPPVVVRHFDTEENVQTVGQWYEAINHAIRSGDVSPLNRLFAPSFVEHTAWSDGVPGDISLDGYLLELHAVYPEARLVPHDVTAEDDRVIVRVEVAGTTSGQFLGLPIAGGRIWNTVDVFRVMSDQIVEHWGDGDPLDRFNRLLSVPVTVPRSARMTVTLERRTFPTGQGEVITEDGFGVIHLETGELRFDLNRLAVGATWLVERAPTPAPVPKLAIAPGASIALKAGDALLVADGAIGSIHNDGAHPATALVVTAAPALGAETNSDRPGDTSPGGNGGSEFAQDRSEVVSTLLAGGPAVDLPSGTAIVSIGRAALTPGGGVASHAVVGLELLVVETGEMVLAASDDAAWVKREPNERSTLLETALLETGDGVLIRQCDAVRYRSSAQNLVDLLLVTIVPTPVGADTM